MKVLRGGSSSSILGGAVVHRAAWGERVSGVSTMTDKENMGNYHESMEEGEKDIWWGWT